MTDLSHATLEELADEIERRGDRFAADLARLLKERYLERAEAEAKL